MIEAALLMLLLLMFRGIYWIVTFDFPTVPKAPPPVKVARDPHVRCAWCQTTISEGSPDLPGVLGKTPTSHGICRICAQEMKRA